MALAPSTDLTKSRLGLRVEEEMTWPFLEKSGSGGFVGSMNLIKAGEQLESCLCSANVWLEMCIGP